MKNNDTIKLELYKISSDEKINHKKPITWTWKHNNIAQDSDFYNPTSFGGGEWFYSLSCYVIKSSQLLNLLNYFMFTCLLLSKWQVSF